MGVHNVSDDPDMVVRMLSYCGENLEPLGVNTSVYKDIQAYKEIFAWKKVEFDARTMADTMMRMVRRGRVSSFDLD